MDEKKQTMIKANTLGLFIARRNSGKSYLMTHLLYLMAKAKNFNWVVVISPTKHTGEWSAILNEHDVKESFDPEWMNSVLEQQALSRKKKKPNPGLIILDDCLGRVNFHSDLMTRLATAGRHYDLTIWCAFQLYHKVPTVLRENADYVFLLGKISEKISKAIFEEYSPPNYEHPNLIRIFSNVAVENHGALLVDRTDDSNLKIVRAPYPLKSFKLKY